MWTLDTRIDITTAGRKAAALCSNGARHDEEPASTAPTDSDGYPLDYDGPGPQWTAEEMAAAEAEAECPTCHGTGQVPVGYGGNMEYTTACPECGPVYS